MIVLRCLSHHNLALFWPTRSSHFFRHRYSCLLLPLSSLVLYILSHSPNDKQTLDTNLLHPVQLLPRESKFPVFRPRPSNCESPHKIDLTVRPTISLRAGRSIVPFASMGRNSWTASRTSPWRVRKIHTGSGSLIRLRNFPPR